MIVAAMEQPHFEWHPRCVWAERVVIALHVDDSFAEFFFLANDVAKNAALFFLKPLARGTQFVFNSARNKDSAGDFGMRMRPLFASQVALVLEYAYIFQANIFFQVGDSRHPDAENPVDVFVAQLRKALGVIRSLHNDFVRAGRTHPVVHAVRPPARFALDAVKRIGMRKYANLPWTFAGAGKNNLLLVDGRAFEPVTGQLVLDFDVNTLHSDVVRVSSGSG